MVDETQGEAPNFFRVDTSEEILARNKENFVEQWDKVRAERPDLNLPVYDVIGLETNPIVAALQAGAYSERLFQQDANEEIRSAVLRQYATGEKLHLHGVPYQLEPMEGESDERFNKRLDYWLLARGLGLVDEYWLFFAHTADERVEDCAVSKTPDGSLELAVLSSENGGAPTDELLEKVRQYFREDNRTPDGIHLKIVSAVLQDADISAQVWIKPDAPVSLYDELDPLLRREWSHEQGLGRDLVDSWVLRVLQTSGVHQVKLNGFETVVCGPSRAIAIRSIAIQQMGRGS